MSTVDSLGNAFAIKEVVVSVSRFLRIGNGPSQAPQLYAGRMGAVLREVASQMCSYVLVQLVRGSVLGAAVTIALLASAPVALCQENGNDPSPSSSVTEKRTEFPFDIVVRSDSVEYFREGVRIGVFVLDRGPDGAIVKVVATGVEIADVLEENPHRDDFPLSSKESGQDVITLSLFLTKPELNRLLHLRLMGRNLYSDADE